MAIPAIEAFTFQEILTPAVAASGFGTTFSVGRKSKVCRLITDTDDDAGVDDSMQLYTVLEFDKTTGAPTKSYPTKERDPVTSTSYTLILGGNMTQAEILIRGFYAWKKIATTVPAVGVEMAEGYEITGR